MFSKLTKGLFDSVNSLFTVKKITPYDVKKLIKTIKKLLVDSDVSLFVIKKLLLNIENKLLNTELKNNLSSKDYVVKVLEEELTDLLSVQNDNRKISHKGYILLSGLQGQGKTTSAGKLARYFKNRDKTVLLTSLDFYRPAAIDQLKKLSVDIEVDFLMTDIDQNMKYNLDLIKKEEGNYDIILIDTAGRNHIDQDMMKELNLIFHYFKPKESLLVSDAMQGQQGIINAKEFLNHINLTGIILSKMDSDGAAGSVLSIESELNIPIKMIGMGEQSNKLEEFKVSKIVNRILDKGDMSSILEKVKEIEESSSDVIDNLKEGKITLNDYLYMIQGLKKMGGMKSLLSMIPGGQTQFADMLNEKQMEQYYIYEYIISSMTMDERKNLFLLNQSRKLRIAKGSGREVNDINKMIKDFKKMKHQIKQFKNFNLNNMQSLFKGVL